MQGMVASSQRAATRVGVEILRAGGNAADGAVTALNGSGRAPARLTIERLRHELMTELPPDHAHTITVPGACAGWFELIARHGTLAMPAILAPAIELAEGGFAVGEVTAHWWADGLARHHGAANL